MSRRLSKIYAKSLMMIAKDNKIEPDNYLKILKNLDNVLSKPWMKRFLSMPNISISEKSTVMQELIENFKLDRFLSRFLIFLLDNRRIDIFEGIVEAFKDYCDQLYGRLTGTAVSAIELTKKEKREIERSLGSLTGKSISLDYKVDENIWGGIVIYAGNVVYDGSVRHIVDKLRQQFDLAN